MKDDQRLSEDYDMRQRWNFPSPPHNKHDIYNYQGRGYLLACAMAGRYDLRQYNVFRSYWMRMDELSFREALARAWMWNQSTKQRIRSVAATIVTELKAEF